MAERNQLNPAFTIDDRHFDVGDLVTVVTHDGQNLGGKVVKIFSFGFAIQSKLNDRAMGGGDAYKTTSLHQEQVKHVEKIS